jgi:hypothetical protein
VNSRLQPLLFPSTLQGTQKQRIDRSNSCGLTWGRGNRTIHAGPLVRKARENARSLLAHMAHVGQLDQVKDFPAENASNTLLGRMKFWKVGVTDSSAVAATARGSGLRGLRRCDGRHGAVRAVKSAEATSSGFRVLSARLGAGKTLFVPTR